MPKTPTRTPVNSLVIVVSLCSDGPLRYNRATHAAASDWAQQAASVRDTRARGLFMPQTRVAVAGLGAIGRPVARRLADGLPGLRLAAIATGNQAKAQAWLDAQNIA